MYGPKIGGAGVGRYVEEIVTHLQQLDTENEYVLFLRRANFDDCAIPPALKSRWTKVVADIPWYSLAEQLYMPRIIYKQKLDLIHYPHFNVPLRAKTPFVCTIHDLIMLDQTWASRATTLAPWKYQLKQFGQQKILAHIAQHARNIITVSDYAKGQIIHRLNISPDRVHVVYNGVESAAILAQKQNKQTARSLPLPPGVQTPFFLNVGNPYPHKNIETLLHAFSFFVKEHPEAHLVLVGPRNSFTQQLEAEAREIEIPSNRVHFLGFVDDTMLSNLYSQASVYVIPSKLEGFGIPPLEALSHGTPVAASRASSIPEILGPAATYFDPNDIEDLFAAMETLLTNKQERIRVLSASHDVLKKYSWDDHARALMDLYTISRS